MPSGYARIPMNSRCTTIFELDRRISPKIVLDGFRRRYCAGSVAMPLSSGVKFPNQSMSGATNTAPLKDVEGTGRARSPTAAIGAGVLEENSCADTSEPVGSNPAPAKIVPTSPADRSVGVRLGTGPGIGSPRVGNSDCSGVFGPVVLVIRNACAALL
jgi:hypothetical protein